MSVGVLLMAYGTPSAPEAIEAYYTHIRRGNRPTDEQLDELRSRYQAIGGTSPLLARTEAQVRGVAAALGGGIEVALGMKHAPPFVEDAMAGLRAHDDVVLAVLAPHDTGAPLDEYLDRATRAAATGQRITAIRSWHLEPLLLDALAARVHTALAPMPEGTEVVFTAHSLPVRAVTPDTPYAAQVAETAEAVAARAGLSRWSTGWQSKGRTPDPWLGPDIVEVLASRATAGVPGVLVCPVGFVADHLEILYDLDVVAAAAAEAHGIAFARTDSLNDDPRLCQAVARTIVRALP
jgi:protoporphyrin/coproporphyrin ferrochelatase